MSVKSINKTEFVRVEKNKNYSTISNVAVKDSRLSWKAKGILVYFLTLPDDWVINLDEIMTHSTDGEKSFRAGFKELKDLGYVDRIQLREGNRITGWMTVIREEPLLSCFVHVENVDVRKEDVQKEGLLSTNNTNNLNILSTDETKSKDNAADEVIKRYKELDYLPKYKVMNKTRKSHINARIDEYGKQLILEALVKANESSFLKKSLQEKANWYTIDWIFKTNNMLKIIEGNYDDKKHSSKPNEQVYVHQLPTNIDYNMGE